MKTAVEWLIEQWPILESQLPQQLIKQAKEIEKEQIVKAAYEFMGTNFDSNMGRAEKYYNQTFKQKEQ